MEARNAVSQDIRQQIVQLNQQAARLYRRGELGAALVQCGQAFRAAGVYFQEGKPGLREMLGIQPILAPVYWMTVKISLRSLPGTVVRKLKVLFRSPEEDRVAQLSRQSKELYEQGRYEEALTYATQVRDLALQLWGPNHAEFALSLGSLGEVHRRLGNYPKAEALMRQALRIKTETLAEDHPAAATTLFNLGSLREDLGDYAEAGRLYQQALDIWRRAFGEDHPQVANALNGLALVSWREGDYDRAHLLYQQALDIRRSALGADHPRVATILHNMATLYHDMGEYGRAEEHFKQALTIARQAHGESHPDVASATHNLAALYREMGEYAAAEPLYQKALEMRRRLLGQQHPSIANSLNDLALLYHDMGDYAASEPLFRQALELMRVTGGEAHPHFATILNNLSSLYYAMGRYEEAAELLQDTLQIRTTALTSEHPSAALGQNNLAAVLEGWGFYVGAEQLYQQALATTRKLLGDDHPRVGIILGNLARAATTMGDFRKAEQLFAEALQIQRAARGEGHPGVAQTLNDMAKLDRALGNDAAAEQRYQRALEINRECLGETHPTVATVLGNLANLYAATNRSGKALKLMGEAAAIDDRIMGQVLALSSESQRMTYLDSLRGRLNRFLSLLVEDLSKSPGAVQAAMGLVLRRKGIGAEALAAQRDALFGGRYPHLESRLRNLTALRMKIARKTLAGAGPEGREAHEQRLSEWNAHREELEAELAREIPEMNLEQKLTAVDLEQLAQALPEGSVLVELVRFDLFDFHALPTPPEDDGKRALRYLGLPSGEKRASRYIAFILPVGQRDEVRMVDLGDAEPIDELIVAFRTSVIGGDRALRPAESIRAQRKAHGQALRKAVFDPLVPTLRGRTRLFIAADGDLTRLPFEALPIANQGRLVDDYHISYLSTGRDLLRLGAASSGEPTAPLVAADPDFDLIDAGAAGSDERLASYGRQSRDLARAGLHFERLPGTRGEGERIAALLGTPPLLGSSALESALKASRSPRILHIATHGFFFPDQPERQLAASPVPEASEAGGLGRLGVGAENPLLRSGLALAGANTQLKGGALPAGAEDGILNGEDVSGLDLMATELVVLSACETGLGEVRAGEGVFGLRRAFALAGAKTLVMSLWKVPDQETQELMVDFYQRILQGQPRAEALRQAQLAMKAKHPDPLYWGAFICQGDPGPLPFGTALGA